VLVTTVTECTSHNYYAENLRTQTHPLLKQTISFSEFQMEEFLISWR